ncbi:single-stranded-DNA-specific exonuclease RecJ [Sporomusa aerivorans]|uniref:single-stranded-DNA-specific exonuclease RecJ n=1 Tax=Sporomusa aerivorans TaxID=204936 RepID=UPI00352AF8CA
MARLQKSWKLFPVKRELARELSQKLHISHYIAQALINRGVTTEQKASEFLYAGSDYIANPYLLKDMDTAVNRIVQAIDNHEKITVYGDYDVDGITASATLFKTLCRLGAKVEFYIPDRQEEGYGLNTAALTKLANSGTKLIVTVDCGISAVHEIQTMLGQLDIIVTDHHQPPPELPAAMAIINPKQPGCEYPEKNLAGVGVAYKLCQALWQYYHDNSKFCDYLDIVAIGTIADIVPLTGENRVLVKLGLEQLCKTENPGLKALLEVCGLTNRVIDSGSVGFVIAPRLNAVGRVSQAAAGVELLLTNNYDIAHELAVLLDTENAERQSIEKDILAKAEAQLETIDLTNEKVLVLAGEEWHSGVIGIVASRLVDKYYKPVIMISLHDGYGKGSCRSIPAFDMYAALTQCSDLLTQFGGHRQAAGLTVPLNNIPALRERLNEIAAATLSEGDYVPVINIDSVLPLEEVNAAFVEQLACLEPYGFANPSPVFACRDVVLGEKRRIGQQNRHLKLKLRNAGVTDVVAWNMGELSDSLSCEQNIDLVFVPKYNEWQGQKSVQLTAQDIRHSFSEETKAKLNTIAPDRNCVGQVYLTLKAFTKTGQHTNLSYQTIAEKISGSCQAKISEQVVALSLTIMEELGLLTISASNEKSSFGVQLAPAPPQKLDLADSLTFRKCSEMRETYLTQHI